LEEDSLLAEEPWVLGYTLGDSGVGSVFAAPVRGVADGNPGVVILGPVTDLGSGTLPPMGTFRPDEDTDLPGFDIDTEENEGFGFAAG
jgi:hypothetical protein